MLKEEQEQAVGSRAFPRDCVQEMERWMEEIRVPCSTLPIRLAASSPFLAGPQHMTHPERSHPRGQGAADCPGHLRSAGSIRRIMLRGGCGQEHGRAGAKGPGCWLQQLQG